MVSWIRPGKPECVVSMKWERLAEVAVQEGLASRFHWDSFPFVLGEAEEIESEWAMFKASIVEAAVYMCFVGLEMTSSGVSCAGCCGNMGMQGC